MQTRRWLSPSQPETLRNATLLLYVNAVFSLLGPRLGLLFGLAGGAAGYGIANDRKWGYYLAIGVTGVRLLLTLSLFLLPGTFSNFSLLISLLFQVALMVLLLHPSSRDYQRIWFK